MGCGCGCSGAARRISGWVYVSYCCFVDLISVLVYFGVGE